jgi:signal transduction histidine kinase
MPGTLSCRADVTALGHALWNLLDNAVKYSTEPHLMTVSVGHRGNAIAIAVADQGFGIPAGERQSVFQKFIRGSGSVQRGIKGTGLGLAMVSHIIAAHGGRIGSKPRRTRQHVHDPLAGGTSCGFLPEITRAEGVKWVSYAPSDVKSGPIWLAFSS